jgi:hypothetical protein
VEYEIKKEKSEMCKMLQDQKEVKDALVARKKMEF